GDGTSFLTVDPPVTAAVVFFHEASKKPSLFAGRPPRPLLGWSPATCCDRPLNLCLPTSGDVDDRPDDPPRFQAARPPTIGPWQPVRPIPAPAINVHAMRRFIPQPPCRTTSASAELPGPAVP